MLNTDVIWLHTNSATASVTRMQRQDKVI